MVCPGRVRAIRLRGVSVDRLRSVGGGRLSMVRGRTVSFVGRRCHRFLGGISTVTMTFDKKGSSRMILSLIAQMVPPRGCGMFCASAKVRLPYASGAMRSAGRGCKGLCPRFGLIGYRSRFSMVRR